MWEQSESGQVKHPFEPIVLGATLLMIPVIIVQRDATSDGWQTAASVANWAIWAVFAAEMTFILTVAPQKLALYERTGSTPSLSLSPARYTAAYSRR
jgi:hypothetical protein